jgi:hypothetical protein
MFIYFSSFRAELSIFFLQIEDADINSATLQKGPHKEQKSRIALLQDDHVGDAKLSVARRRGYSP